MSGGNAMMRRSGIGVDSQIFNGGVVRKLGSMLFDAFMDGSVGLASVEGRSVIARDFIYGIRCEVRRGLSSFSIGCCVGLCQMNS